METFDSEIKEEIDLKLKDFSLDNWESGDSIGVLWMQKHVLCVPLRDKAGRCSHVMCTCLCTCDTDFVLLFSLDSV